MVHLVKNKNLFEELFQFTLGSAEIWDQRSCEPDFQIQTPICDALGDLVPFVQFKKREKPRPHGCFSRFLNHANGTKSQKASHIGHPCKNFNLFDNFVPSLLIIYIHYL